LALYSIGAKHVTVHGKGKLYGVNDDTVG